MQRFTTLISGDELQASLQLPDWRIVDCRFDLKAPEKGRQEYLAGHISGAAYADLDGDLADPIRADTGRHPLPDPQRFSATLGSWGISNASQVVVYDHGSGAIAARLWWLLRWMGHRDVAVLNGGIAGWIKAGRPLVRHSQVASIARFEPHPDNAMVVTTAELLAGREAIALVDARDRQRFLGHVEPIDPVAGHVPGALNFPFSESLDPGGEMLSADELRIRWQKLLGNNAQRPWVAMCGSGVTACHLALSAEVAGIRAPRLYVGSWSEWIRDPGRPVATGAGQAGGPTSDRVA